MTDDVFRSVRHHALPELHQHTAEILPPKEYSTVI